MEQLVELMEMLGDGFLPVQQSKLGKRVGMLFGYLKDSAMPTEQEAAKIIGVVSGSSDFRKVKHHLKLALIISLKSSFLLVIKTYNFITSM